VERAELWLAFDVERDARAFTATALREHRGDSLNFGVRLTDPGIASAFELLGRTVLDTAVGAVLMILTAGEVAHRHTRVPFSTRAVNSRIHASFVPHGGMRRMKVGTSKV
jgi:hypothetical protein